MFSEERKLWAKLVHCVSAVCTKRRSTRGVAEGPQLPTLGSS